jgi:hypothetical protein
MRWAAAVLLLTLIQFSAAETIRTTAGSELRLSKPGVTAAYSLQPDCAEARVVEGFVVLTGIRACSTHIIALAGTAVTELDITVSPRAEQIERLRAARLAARHIHEVGSVATFYDSNPSELTTALNMMRSEAGRTTSLSLTMTEGYGFSPHIRRTAIPFASLRFSGPSSALTLLDSWIDQSLATDSTVIRGLHWESNSSFFHAGVVSLTGFRERLIESSPDRTVSAGYRFALSRHSGITPGVQWISASTRYLAGKSGAIGSLAYDYRNPNSLQFRAELGVSDGVGASSRLEYHSSENQLSLRATATPARFPGLSTAPPRGLNAAGSWAHQFSDRFQTDFSGSQYKYALFDGSTLTNSASSAIAQFRPLRSLTLSAGFAASRFSRPNTAALTRRSLPVGFSYDTRRFGNLFQYRFSDDARDDKGGHYLRDSVRFGFGSFTLRGFVERQTQAPTLDFILTSVPGLRQALLDAGISATTPEQILQFMQTNSDLIALGFLRNLTIDIAPVRTGYGGTLQWAAKQNRASARLEWRRDNQERVASRAVSTLYDARFSVRLGGYTEVSVGGSVFESRFSNFGSDREPVVSFGIRRQLTNVPDMLRPSRGSIHGIVFFDTQGKGEIQSYFKGMAGIYVVLDGIRRARTNGVGAYSFGSVSPGTHTVEVLHDGLDPYLFTTSSKVEVSEDSSANFGLRLRTATLFGTVRNDAGKSLRNVRIRIAGKLNRELQTSGTGAFSVTDLEPGTYTVSVDPDSIPPSYALATLQPRTVTTGLGEPGRADFVVRALRSVAGLVSCNGTPLSAANAHVRLAGDGHIATVDDSGQFIVRDLPSGSQTIELVYGSSTMRSAVDLPQDPAVITGINFDVCGLSSK